MPTPTPADCPHSWADHCPPLNRCGWRKCVVIGCGHVEIKADPSRHYDEPTPPPREGQ